MSRMQQSRRQRFGYVYSPQVQNNIVEQTAYRNPYLVMEHQFDQNSASVDGMDGEGLMDMARTILSKGKQAGKWAWSNRDKIKQAGEKASDFYASDVGTALRNVVPDSDSTARNAYPGERHAILELPNGKYGTANYMGPGTQVLKRLKRGDPPRGPSDRTAMRHDVDYMMAANAPDKATQDKMIRAADQRMIKNLNRIAKNKRDFKKNIFQGRRLIQGKMAAEDVGLMEKGSFGGPLKKDTADDMVVLKKSLSKLEQEGYGVLPAQALKMKLLKQHARRAKANARGAASSGQGMYGQMLKANRDYHQIKKVKGKTSIKGKGLTPSGGGLRLAGQRGLASPLRTLTPTHMKKIAKVCQCEAMKGEGIGSIFKSVIKTLGPIAKELGPTLLKEIVLPLAKSAIEKKIKGKGSSGQGLHTGGDGLRLAGQRGKGYASKSKSYGTTQGHKLMGQGAMMDFAMKQIIPSLAKSVGVDIKHIPMGKITPIIKKALQMAKTGDIKSITQNLSKVILPLLTQGKLKTMGHKMSGKGLGSVVDYVGHKTGLNDLLANGLMKAFKWYFKKPQSGKGLNPGGGGLKLGGGNFWSGFKKGFTSVFKPGAKILGAAASAMGQPEIGVPLELISGML